jgi:hypothetical protein
MDILGTERNFAGLGLADLVEARDLYHWHLTHQRNVVGTAVGLYYIRTADAWPSRRSRPTAPTTPGVHKPPRTFQNSEIRDYSWPCVVVLVERWLTAQDFGTGPGQVPVEEKVPTTLYLPDGRTVPVCVVQVDPAEPVRDPVPAWVWPERVVGGGLPVITYSQGEEHVASVGTLVTDGHTVYALTAGHVCGPAGTPISTRLRRSEVQVGRASRHQLTRVPFGTVYPDLVSHRSYLTLDAGLVEVDEVADWSSQTYGLPPAGPFADLSEHNLTTKLVNAEVVAFGAASGYLRGRIAALLFRYRSIGGYDDITDFLIAPGPGQRGSQPGDSGTIWHLRQAAADGTVQLLPVALQWGGENLVGSTSGSFNFALGSSLTNVLRLLDVSLVVDHNTQAQPFWGKTGHYTIASLACEHLKTSRLRTLMRNNLDRIGFQLSALSPDDIDAATTKLSQHPHFVPLADVPDLVWKNLPTKVLGGRDTSYREGPEHPTHYADIDEPRPTDGKTLRQLCMANPALVTVEAWQEFYSSLGHTDPADRGLLPFRVWQFFDEMVAAVVAGDVTRFVCAAGLVSHYVGDACQPLHGSYLADGAPATPTTPAIGAGVHSAYETAMVDAYSAEILAGLQATLTHRGAEQGPILTGHDAAVAVVRLMDRTAKAIKPADLVAVFAQTQVGKTTQGPTVTKAVLATLWDRFGPATVKVMADGTRTLAAIWEASFTQGRGVSTIPTASTKAVETAALQALYQDPDFVRSLDLDHIGAVLT